MRLRVQDGNSIHTVGNVAYEYHPARFIVRRHDVVSVVKVDAYVFGAGVIVVCGSWRKMISGVSLMRRCFRPWLIAQGSVVRAHPLSITFSLTSSNIHLVHQILLTVPSLHLPYHCKPVSSQCRTSYCTGVNGVSLLF